MIWINLITFYIIEKYSLSNWPSAVCKYGEWILVWMGAVNNYANVEIKIIIMNIANIDLGKLDGNVISYYFK